MFDTFLAPDVLPFSIALALLFGLAGLELVALLLGGSLVAGDSDPGLEGAELDAPDLDGPEIESPGLSGASFADLGELPLDADGLAEIDGLEAPEGGDAPEVGGGLSQWLGLGKMPMLIWLAAVLLGFGLSGTALQLALREVFSFMVPAWAAAVPAGGFALWFARSFGAGFARILPQVETEALSDRSLGRRRGIVTQGTAAKGRPAEVRVMDGFGNAHYLRAEPFAKGEEIHQGTEVLVIRDRRRGSYVLIPLSE